MNLNQLNVYFKVFQLYTVKLVIFVTYKYLLFFIANRLHREFINLQKVSSVTNRHIPLSRIHKTANYIMERVFANQANIKRYTVILTGIDLCWYHQLIYNFLISLNEIL